MAAFHIRRSEPEDAAALAELFGDAKAQGQTLQLPYASTAMWQQRVREQSDHFVLLSAERERAILGQIGIEVMHSPRRRHVANIGMAVHPDYRQQGVGRALVDAAIDLCESWLQIKRIELEVYTDNDAAIALYQRCGFRREGLAKSYAWRDGEYVDVLLMARLGHLG